MNCLSVISFKSFTSNSISSLRSHVLFYVFTDILRNYKFVNCPASTDPLFLDFDNLRPLSRNAHNFRWRGYSFEARFKFHKTDRASLMSEKVFATYVSSFRISRKWRNVEHRTAYRRKLALWWSAHSSPAGWNFSISVNAIVKLKTTFINIVVCDPEICNLTSSILETILI